MDSQDIQKLIDDLPSTGGTITLPIGEHILTTTNHSLEFFPNGEPIKTAILINKPNITFEGHGSNTILKLAPHTKMRAISISSSNVTIRNLVIDGNKANRNGSLPYPDGEVVDGLLFGSQSASNLVFENLEIRNGIEDAMGSWLGTNIIARYNYIHDNGTEEAGGAGISLSGVKQGYAYNNRIENNTATGIWSSFNAKNINIYDNLITENHSGGITIGGGDTFTGIGSDNNGFSIQNNRLAKNGSSQFASITIFASINGVISNNTIESSYYDNFQVGGTKDYPSSNWTIKNNICNGPKGITNLGHTINIILIQNGCETNFVTAKPGDLNGDGKVNIYDYSRLISGYGTVYTNTDFVNILANYGK
jgi:hypothetical protein